MKLLIKKISFAGRKMTFVDYGYSWLLITDDHVGIPDMTFLPWDFLGLECVG